MKFTWKIEEMALMAEKANEYGKKIYKAEKELSREEKIEFLDKRNNGFTSYILNLAEKFQKEDSLKLKTVIAGSELFARIDQDNKIKNWSILANNSLLAMVTTTSIREEKPDLSLVD